MFEKERVMSSDSSDAFAREPLEDPSTRSNSVTKQTSVRINVNLSQETYSALKDLAKDAGMDMSEFVRNALRVYTSLQREKLEGKRVYIGNSNKVEKELLLP